MEEIELLLQILQKYGVTFYKKDGLEIRLNAESNAVIDAINPELLAQDDIKPIPGYGPPGFDRGRYK